MTDYVQILLSDHSTVEDLIVAADYVINNYDLPLARDEILQVFEKSRNNIKEIGSHINYYYTRHKFLFSTLLNSNKNMLIAIIRDWYCNNYRLYTSAFVSNTEPYKIGYYADCNPCIVINSYQNLLNYNDFEIDDLNLTDEIKLQIQEYRNEKYGGKLTKVITNN